MRYAEAVAAAPPGSSRFGAEDVARFSPAALRLLFAPGPAAPPLREVAAALGDRPRLLRRVAAGLPDPDRARLLRLARRPASPEQREAAGRRLVRGAFWSLTYELEPELWDRLADRETVSPELVADLPANGARVLEVAAGSGRLAAVLAPRAALLVAVEPCAGLRRLLRLKVPQARVVAGIGQRLPVVTGWADLTVSCASFGPHAPLGGEPVRRELERCTRPGGLVALVGPERPSWWQERGYTRRDYPRPSATLEADLEGFFGPAHPPHWLLTKRR